MTPFMTLQLRDEPGMREVRIVAGSRVFILEAAGHRVWREDGGYHTSRASVVEAVGEPWVEAAETLLHAADGLSARIGEYRRRVHAEYAELRDEAERTLREARASALAEAAAAYPTARHDALAEWRRETPRPSDVPEDLRDVRHVRRLMPQPAHVYFLLRQGRVVYVGKSCSLWPGRIHQHIEAGDKSFDDVWYLPVDAGSVDEVERAFIRRFRPEYNRAHNSPALRAAGGAR